MNSLQHLECMLQISHRRDSMKCETIGRPRENQFLDSIRVTTQDDNRTPMRNRSDIPELGKTINTPPISNNEPER